MPCPCCAMCSVHAVTCFAVLCRAVRCCWSPLTCRLDKSVNTLTFQRALLALAALWHRMPLQEDTWLTTLKKWFGSASNSSPTFKTDVTEWYEEREHAGTFEGSALSGVIMSADKEFDWSSLPAASGGLVDVRA